MILVVAVVVIGLFVFAPRGGRRRRRRGHQKGLEVHLEEYTSKRGSAIFRVSAVAGDRSVARAWLVNALTAYGELGLLRYEERLLSILELLRG